MAFLPKQVAGSSIRRARRFLKLADAKLPDNKVKNDLRRMAVVQAVAALDSYMHALVLRRLADVRDAKQLPKKLAKLDINFADLGALGDAWIAAQRAQIELVKKKKPISIKRPWVQVKRVLQERLLRETFQSYDQIGSALSMAGVEKGWSKISARLGEQPEQTKRWLSRLVHRRNQIVHEGDIQRQSKPRSLKFNEVDHGEIQDQIDRVEKLVDAIDAVVR